MNSLRRHNLSAACTPTLPTIVTSGRYRIIAPLGSGVQAQLFLCDSGEEEVALRVPRLLSPEEVRFFNVVNSAPAHATVGLVRCLDIVDVLFEGQQTQGYILEHGGVSLRSLLNRVQRIEPSDALAIHDQVCEAIHTLERFGYFHTDLSPSNILIDEDQKVKLCDYGNVVRIHCFDRTGYANNRRYGAPAQYGGNPDLFSAGLTLYEAVSGEHLILPFTTAEPLEVLKDRTRRAKECLYVHGKLCRTHLNKIQAAPPSVRRRLLEALDPKPTSLP